MKQSTHMYLLFRSLALKLLRPFFAQEVRSAIDPKTVKKILVVTDFRLGDAILSVPALKALKMVSPNCRITVFCNRYSADVFGMLESVDAVAKYHNKNSYLENWKILQKLSSEQFDVAIDLVQDYPLAMALWTLFSRAKLRVGYNWYGRGVFFNVKIPCPEATLHAVDEMLLTCRKIGITPDSDVPELSAPKNAQEFVDAELIKAGVRKGERIIAIHPGGFYLTQRWMPERFAEIAKLAIEKLQVHVVVLGTEHERAAMKIIAEETNLQCNIFFNYSISNIAAVLSRADCLLCNNSGALHIAAAVGTRTVSTMGPTVAERWWPRGKNHIVIRKPLPCIGCNSGTCIVGTHQCMNDITVQEMFEAVKRQLDEKKGYS